MKRGKTHQHLRILVIHYYLIRKVNYIIVYFLLKPNIYSTVSAFNQSICFIQNTFFFLRLNRNLYLNLILLHHWTHALLQYTEYNSILDKAMSVKSRLQFKHRVKNYPLSYSHGSWIQTNKQTHTRAAMNLIHHLCKHG